MRKKMMIKKTDVPAALNRIDTFLRAAEKAKGTAAQLTNGAAMEVHLYNIACRTIEQLKNARVTILDLAGEHNDKSDD